MNERLHFASLLFASHMGVLEKSQVIAAADKRLVELDKPDSWLIELSSQGDCPEVEELILSSDEGVYVETFRLACRAWLDERISEARFRACCQTLLRQAGPALHETSWYTRLIWIDDEFGLVEQGILRREESIKRIQAAVEDLLRE